MNIKVAVLDDHEFICRAISALGRDYPELEVVYTSTYPEEFQAWCLENHPDVAMVDLMLHGQLAGHETIRVLSQAGISCLAFTADHRRVPISMAMRAGARGLALKDESPDKHFETLREIHETGWSPSSAMAAALIEDAAELPALSAHELRCLRLASEGVPIKAIGRQFNPIISLSTVKTYLARAYEKYAAVGRPVGNTTAAATQTWEDGWFDLDGTAESS